MYKQLIIATLMLGPYLAAPALAKESPDASAPVTINNTTIVAPSVAPASAAPVTINNTVIAPSVAPAVAPAPVTTKERVTERSTTNNTTRLVAVPIPPPPVEGPNWLIIGLLSAVGLVAIAAVIGGFKSSKTTSTTRIVDRTLR